MQAKHCRSHIMGWEVTEFFKSYIVVTNLCLLLKLVIACQKTINNYSTLPFLGPEDSYCVTWISPIQREGGRGELGFQ